MMKYYWITLLFIVLLHACGSNVENHTLSSESIYGTWELVAVTNEENGETIDTFVPGRRMIKIITPTHFSFVNHDLNKGQDSSAFFAAGAGNYSLKGNKYSEKLEFCTARGWEGHVFEFEIEIKGDTLIQQGVEKSDALGVDRYIYETYVRVE